MPPKIESSPYIDMWMDYEPEVYVEKKDPTTRLMVPEQTLTGCTFRISATEQGAAIGTLTGITATHAGAGAPGHYVGAIDLAVLQAQLPALTYPHGTIVYRQFLKAGDIDVDAVPKRVRRRKDG